MTCKICKQNKLPAEFRECYVCNKLRCLDCIDLDLKEIPAVKFICKECRDET